ncbi:MAG: hypothetical protein JO157_03825 [Acetobacteraceae bacterium]|nr:hypothetical protein [Acetobacteraceae bacterium]
MSEGQAVTAAAEAVPILRFRAAHGWAGSPPVLGLVPEAALDRVLSREAAEGALDRLALYEDDEGRAGCGAGWRASWPCCGRAA